MTCPICSTGPIFAGHVYDNGEIVDTYHPCACPEVTDDDYERACGFDPSFVQFRNDIDARFDLPSHLLA